ncbi:MAG: TIM-barrel protein, putative [Methanobacterium sp. Maddingley MBC34]|nr:MAG: TIM-barrel protein, putative [Methanobacterium sp. Maddingley MBC34]
MEFIEVLAPMAGITDGAFCRDISTLGFDMVTLGGYNADQSTASAGQEILARGRPEFDLEPGELISHLEEQSLLLKVPELWNGMVSVNLRAVTPDPIIEVSRLQTVDVVEINAHCRQPEITQLGCGQALLENPSHLEKFTREVVKKAKSKVSVKIRANIPGVDEFKTVRAIDHAGADYLHVDAMKPGFNSADYDMVKLIRHETSMFIIGNNSIRDVESARKMLAAGADGISIARAAIGGTLPFDLARI